MQRFVLKSVGIVLLIGSACYGQSLADAARANRKQKAPEGVTAKKVISDDDVAAATDVTVHLVPGAISTGGGELIAPGMWKHGYSVTNLDGNTVFQRWGSPHRDHTRERASRSIL